MCTKSYFRIKSVSPAGIKYSYLPCGKCYDCRQSLKSQWIFRVRAELSALTAKGWRIGFFTLTYNDEHLPLIPKDLIKGPYRPIPCFSKVHIRFFVNSIRKWLQKRYKCFKDLKPRMMICSEFGELRKRPHYHGIICFPPCVDARDLHLKMKKIWYSPTRPDIKGMDDGFGYFGPFDFDGDVDDDGKVGKPFVCDSVKAGAMYACKYVCKDINFLESVSDVDFFRKRKFYWDEMSCKKVYLNDDFEDCCSCPLFDNTEACGQALDGPEESYIVTHRKMVELPPYCVLKLSDYFPFHFQTRGMGKCFLDGKNDMQLLELYKNGFLFDGDSDVSALPVYLKNKIIFTPKYVFDDKTGKRLVRREATAFFREHCQELYELKVRAAEERFNDFTNLDYWRALGVSDDDMALLKRNMPNESVSNLASDFVCYYGVPYRECYDIAPYLQWYRRYDYDYVDVTNVCLIGNIFWSYIQRVCDLFFRLQAKYEWLVTDRREKDARIKERISQFHKFKH